MSALFFLNGDRCPSSQCCCGVFLKFIYFIYLFLGVLGLRFCARAFSSCGERGPLFIAVRGPLTVVASLVAEHRLQTRRLSSCGSRAQSLHGMWDLPRPGLEPVSPALAGRLSTTAPPGNPPPPRGLLLPTISYRQDSSLHDLPQVPKGRFEQLLIMGGAAKKSPEARLKGPEKLIKIKR